MRWADGDLGWQGVVLVDNMFENRDNIFNDRYLLGNITQYEGLLFSVEGLGCISWR